MATIPNRLTEFIRCSHSLSKSHVCDECGGVYHLCPEPYCDIFQIACGWTGGCHPKCEAWYSYRPFENRVSCCDDFPSIPCPRQLSPKSEFVSDAVPDAY